MTKRMFAKNDDDDDGDKAWTCLALVTRSLRGKMMKMPRSRAIAMLMITWYMRMMTPSSGTNLRYPLSTLLAACSDVKDC